MGLHRNTLFPSLSSSQRFHHCLEKWHDSYSTWRMQWRGEKTGSGGEGRGGRAAQVSPIFALPLSSADSHTARLRRTQFKHSSQALFPSIPSLSSSFSSASQSYSIRISTCDFLMYRVSQSSKWHFFIQATKGLYSSKCVFKRIPQCHVIKGNVSSPGPCLDQQSPNSK